jgi:hypothetical protein
MQPSAYVAQTAALSVREAREIAREAYIYGYPPFLMEIIRRVSTSAQIPQALSK